MCKIYDWAEPLWVTNNTFLLESSWLTAVSCHLCILYVTETCRRWIRSGKVRTCALCRQSEWCFVVVALRLGSSGRCFTPEESDTQIPAGLSGKEMSKLSEQTKIRGVKFQLRMTVTVTQIDSLQDVILSAVIHPQQQGGITKGKTILKTGSIQWRLSSAAPVNFCSWHLTFDLTVEWGKQENILLTKLLYWDGKLQLLNGPRGEIVSPTAVHLGVKNEPWTSAFKVELNGFWKKI